MLGLFVSNAYALASPSAASGQGEMPFYASPFFMIAVLMAVFYFFILRPQQKERKKLEQKLSSLKMGDRVITSGGIHGIITNASGDPIKIKIADNVKIDVSRSAIVSVLADTSDADAKSKEDK